MNGGILFAAAVGVTNTIALNVCGLFFDDGVTSDAQQLVTNIAQALSPFIALLFTRLYVKFDHPPELIRAEAGLDAAIKTCKKHLKDKQVTDEFKVETRLQLSDFMRQKQQLRVDFESNKPYASSLPSQVDTPES